MPEIDEESMKKNLDRVQYRLLALPDAKLNITIGVASGLATTMLEIDIPSQDADCMVTEEGIKNARGIGHHG